MVLGGVMALYSILRLIVLWQDDYPRKGQGQIFLGVRLPTL